MRFWNLRTLAMFVCLAWFVPACWPQASTSAVRGTVRDQSKAVVVGSSVTLTNTDTNVTSKSVTNQAGLYLFSGVFPGPYRLVVEAPGMQKFEGALIVQVQQDAVVDAVLNVGQVATQVTVQDVTPMLVVDNPTLGHILERQRIEELPINGRLVQTLLANTVPGMEGSRAYGEPLNSMEWVQDGAVFSNRYADYGGVDRPPGLDTIEEFKVETNSSSAKYARPTTAILSTKRGANALHGALFETARNNGVGVARARTDFYTKPPHLVRNEFGASAGGPVFLPKLYNGRNRTFWFFAWEDYRDMEATTGAFEVPTQAMRNGDFSGLADAQGRRITIYDPLTTNAAWARQPFSYGGKVNVIDPARLNPIAKYLYGVLPQPTNPEVNPLLGNNWYGPVPAPWRKRTITLRIDHSFSDRDQFYARYTKGSSDRITAGGLPTLNSELDNYSGINPLQSIALSHVHIFSPTLFNELTVSASRFVSGTNYDRTTDWTDTLGLPNPGNQGGFPLMSSTGLANLVFTGGARHGQAMNSFLLDDGVTKMHGRHELQFGVHFRYDQLNVLPDSGPPITTDWGTLATSLYDPTSSRTNPLATPQTGQNLANMYLGAMSYSKNAKRNWYYMRGREYALYFQDNFKITSRLTLNLGLRWDMWPAESEKNGVMASYDPQRRAIVLGADVNKLYAAGATVPSIVNRFTSLGATFESYQQAGLPQSLMYSNWKDFGPRLGFAYRVGDGGRSFVVRGGYCVSYFPILMNTWTTAMQFMAPFVGTFSYNPNNAAQSPDGIASYWMRTAPTVYGGVNSSRNLINLEDASAIVRGTGQVTYFDPHQPDSRVQNWNFTLEKEVMRNTVARVAYVGNHSDHLQQSYSYNQPPSAYIWFVTTGLPQPTGEFASVAERPWDQQTFGQYNQYLKTGWSNYQGLQFEMERRYHKGYGYQLFYNVSNALAATDAIPATNQFMPGTVPEDLDQRNRLVNYSRDSSIPNSTVS